MSAIISMFLGCVKFWCYPFCTRQLQNSLPASLDFAQRPGNNWGKRHVFEIAKEVPRLRMDCTIISRLRSIVASHALSA